MSDIWAVIPVKEFDGAKHRLSGLLSPPQRRLLAETMLTDMLDAVAGSRLLAGVMIVTLDPHATALGKKIGARIVTEGARDGHTGSVNAGRRLLAGEGRRRHDHDARRHSSHSRRRDRRGVIGASRRALFHDLAGA